jgi:hypothetical protein
MHALVLQVWGTADQSKKTNYIVEVVKVIWVLLFGEMG